MKRMILHICFWLAYLGQDILLSFLWSAGRLHDLSTSERIFRSFLLCTALLPPKILFTYLVLFVILDRIVKQNRSHLASISLLIMATVGAIFMIRAIEVYFVYPVLFQNREIGPDYFNPFGLLFTFIDLGYISGVAIAIKLVRFQLANKEREKILIKEKLETELKFLRNQTNPHFLFNTLNNIYGLARRKSDDTADVVMKLSKLLRFMLYETKKKFIRIDDELKMLEDYINLEKIRYTKKLCVRFDKQIDDDSENIAPLLLLPFVENAFKHGASENRFESFIHINVCLKQGILKFDIENSKEEGTDDAITDNIGLGNVRRQLELMYEEHYLQIFNESNTFKVVLEINLKSHEELQVSHRGR